MKEIWENKRYRSMITLGIWGIFIIFIFILAAFGNNNQNVTEEPKKENENVIETPNKENQDEILQKLLKDLQYSCEYNITIVENDNKILLQGSYFNNKYGGFMTTNNEVLWYQCENKICYKNFVDHKEQMDTYLFEGIKDPLYVTTISNHFVLEEETEDRIVYKYDEINSVGAIKNEIVVEKDAKNNELNYKISQINTITTNLKIEILILEPPQTNNAENTNQ